MMFVDRWRCSQFRLKRFLAPIPSFAIFVVLRSVQHLTVQFGLKTLLKDIAKLREFGHLSRLRIGEPSGSNPTPGLVIPLIGT